MRWLTRDCLSGGLSDNEWQERYDEYERHLERVSRIAGFGAEELLPASLNLHDGQPDSWGFQGSSFWWRVLVGDLQRGYEWATIVYSEAELFPSESETEFDSWPLSDREIGADELDIIGEGRLEQRFLLWPAGEFGIRFTSCLVGREPADLDDRR